MKTFAKIFMVAIPAFVLAACSNSYKIDREETVVTTGTFGGMSAQELQQRYNTVYFSFDRDIVEGEYKQLLNTHAELLNANKKSTVVIEGHTDERGTPEYNIALGQRRADAVKRYLTTRGVNPSQLSTVSYGEEKPAVLGHTEADYAKNRRAVLAY